MDRRGEIGSIIGDVEYWGNGIAIESARLVFDYCFKELNLHKIITRASASNIGSCKVSEKLKMKRKAVLDEYFYSNGNYENAYIYGILKDEWLS